MAQVMRFEVVQITHRTVKSIRARNVQKAQIVDYGLRNNGVFVITTPKPWSQGNFLRMSMRGCLPLNDVRDEVSEDGEMTVLRAPDMQDLHLQLDNNEGDVTDVVMWKEPYKGIEVHAGSEWFSKYLSMEGLKLVWLSPKYPRILTAKPMNRQFQTSWVDTRPFHFITTTTIEHMAHGGGVPLDPARFRGITLKPLDGAFKPYDEDKWRVVGINGVLMDFVKRKVRCPITCIDPTTNVTSREPLNFAEKDNRNEGDGTLYGVDFVHRVPNDMSGPVGLIEVGCILEVLES
ncbi:MOSC domain-containing protein [Candidatus Parcubacteria bacterium]|nr:MOSC domain-containing protein [Candidatus Parcubacteria bacterium]